MVSYEIRSMVEGDVSQIAQIETEVFTSPWSEAAIRSELEDNSMSFYMVIAPQDKPDEVIGYCGIWKIFDEGHITNIAIRPEDQGKKLGQMLLYAVIQWAWANQLGHLTLEVRVSNDRAIHMYEKAGFVRAGIRPGYYDGGGEDALLMWLHKDDDKVNNPDTIAK